MAHETAFAALRDQVQRWADLDATQTRQLTFHPADVPALLSALRLAAAKAERAAINIIFDGPPSHESGRFVEVETDDRRSISIGEWIKRDDGLWALRITALPVASSHLKGGKP